MVVADELLINVRANTAQAISGLGAVEKKVGKLSFNIKIEGFDKMLNTQDQTSNRIAFSIIIAALILGSAMLINSKVPPILFGVSVIGIAGFIAAAVMGIWLLVAIIGKGRL